MRDRFVIGTRGSELALWQANFVKTRLQQLFPDHLFDTRIIRTTGDEMVDVALSKIGDKGLFTRQIETQLLAGEIDLAVHSLKDLQTEQPPGLVIGAVCKREMAGDVLLAKTSTSIDDLPEGAKVATGSLRRKSQLLNYRPDLRVVEIRGNVPTRLKKFDQSDIDSIILAHAGVQRLGFEHRISQLIPFEVMLPAVGQGAVAIEVRDTDEQVSAFVAKLDDRPTRICITAERAFLRRLEGGCQVPVGAFAKLEDNRVRLEGMVGSPDGATVFREELAGPVEEAEILGSRLADVLIEKGARELLDNARAEAQSTSKAVL